MAPSANLVNSADLAAFFEQTYASFLRAALQPVDKYYRIAGFQVRLRFAHEGLSKRLTLSLAHLEEASGKNPSLTICIFDTASSGETLKAPDWLLSQLLVRGELPLPQDTPYRVVVASVSSSLSLLDEATSRAIFFAQDIEKLPSWDIAAPFLSLFHLFLKGQRTQVIHAAAVGSANGEALLLVGPGGAGKSTTAVSCLFSGMHYLGDDYTAVTSDPPYQVHSLYCSGKLTPFSLELLAIKPSETIGSEDKAILFFQSHYSHLLTRSSRLKAIVVPSISPTQASNYCSIHPAEALRALAPSCILQLPYSGGELFTRLATLTRSVPCFKAMLGTSPQANSEMLRELLAPSHKNFQEFDPSFSAQLCARTRQLDASCHRPPRFAGQKNLGTNSF
jgi:hypothetical protein